MYIVIYVDVSVNVFLVSGGFRGQGGRGCFCRAQLHHGAWLRGARERIILMGFQNGYMMGYPAW